MKNAICSWRDMAAIRKLIEATEKGNGDIYKMRRCLKKEALCEARATLDVTKVLDRAGSVYTDSAQFRPSHAYVLARAFRKEHGQDSDNWPQDQVVKWYDRVESEKLTVSQLRKSLVASRREKAAAALDQEEEDEAESNGKSKKKSKQPIQLCRMEELLPTLSGVNAIITDPPYPEEFLPLYGELARLAKDALVPDGVLAVMCGQTYLPQVLALMTPHMTYRWTLAYLTPGGQSVQLFPRKVNTFWKPVLLFGESADWIGDVIQSDVNDNDKRFHDWGQSESGMARLVERLTLKGALVCDPFVGGGTTAVVCANLGRRFVGCDIDPVHVQQTRERLKKKD